MKSRIVYYTDCSFFAGCENMLANFSGSQELRREYDLRLVFRRSSTYSEGLFSRAAFLREECIPVTVFRETHAGGLFIPLRPFLFLTDVVLLFFVFRKLKPALLHVNNGGFPGSMSCSAAAVAGRLLGIKVIYVVNNLAVPYRSLSRAVDWVLDFWTRASVELFVNGSTYATQRLRKVLLLNARRSRSLPNGLCPRLPVQSRELTRQVWGVADSSIVIGIVALLEKRKGHEVLLRAMARLIDWHQPLPEFLLVIEGEGPERRNLEGLVSELGLDKQVLFLGRAASVFSVYAAIDVFAFSSTGNEDFPNVILEVLSQGLPVVATRVAGVPEQVQDGVSGLLVPPGDPEAMAIALWRVLSQGELRSRLSDGARERFQSQFTEKVAVRRYLELYQKLLTHQQTT